MKKDFIYIQELSFIFSFIFLIINIVLLFSGNGSIIFIVLNYITFIITVITGLLNLVLNKKERKVFVRLSLILSILFVVLASIFLIKNSNGENTSTCENVMSCDDEVDKDGYQTCYYCKDMYDDECMEEVKCKKTDK